MAPAADITYIRLKVSTIRFSRPWRTALVLAAAFVPTLAQFPPEAAEPVAAPEPQMVDLNVVALDGHGQPVPDLRAEDLRITDNGKPQRIALFRRRESASKTPLPAPAGGVSNRGGENIPRATLILFDLMNETFATRGVATNRLEHSLASLESADYPYLYLLRLDGRLYPVHGLPGPEERPAAPGAPPWTRQVKPQLDKALREVTQTRPVDNDTAMRAQLTFRALDAIAAELARVPGYKSIVWVTDGFPIELGPRRSDTGDYVDFTPFIRQMSEAMDRAHVAIYPVRQVMLGSANNVDGAQYDGAASISTLDLFAGMTGGRPDSGKDIGEALRQAMADMRTSYLVSYYPPDNNWNNKLHKLRVTTTRKDVRIQSRTGYYAWEEPPGSRAGQAVDSVSRTAFDAAEIGLTGSLSRVAGGFHLDARIDARDLALVPGGGYYDGHLRLALVGYAQGTLSQRGPLVPLDVHLSAAEHDKALQQGIPYVQNLNFDNSVQTLRMIVFDRGTEAVGSLTIPVPPPKR